MRTPLSGLAGMLGGAYLLFSSVAFAMTHGSTTYNRNEPWLGVEAVDYSKFLFLYPLLFFVALLGYEESAARAGRLGRVGLRLAQVSCMLQSISYVMQCNIVDPLTQWQSPVVIWGWLLFLLTVPLFTIGILLWAIALRRRRLLSRTERISFSVVGVCSVAALLLESWISTRSDGSWMWELAIAAKNFPVAFGWMVLGFMMAKRRSKA
ncbi:hypothetical protein MO973_42565 [Paenibacillus sp. TRM 82003]|nr:hypothetical protein [Paenibacillus sp. TRM 82003]